MAFSNHLILIAGTVAFQRFGGTFVDTTILDAYLADYWLFLSFVGDGNLFINSMVKEQRGFTWAEEHFWKDTVPKCI